MKQIQWRNLISLGEQCSPQLLNEVERTQASQTDRKSKTRHGDVLFYNGGINTDV